MRLHSFRIAGFVVTLAASALFSGCVIAPARPYYGDYGAEGSVMVAPPQPRDEIIGLAPAAGLIWLGGYWRWTGRRHDWVGGHWEAQRPGQRWVPHQWQRDGGGWRFREGHWGR